MSPEERTRRDLEQDRKDAERELQRYEEAGILDVAAEHTADIVGFWELRGTAVNKIFIDLLITCLTSKTNSCFLFFSVLPWMSFPRKHHLSLPSAFSHLAKRFVQPVAPAFCHQSLKPYKCSSFLTNPTG
jgi:hypothetical protein